METKTLNKYESPKYPQKEQVKLQPSLLRKNVFRRWERLFDLGISGMLVAGLSLSGCDDGPAANSTTNITQGETNDIKNPDSVNAKRDNIKEVNSLVAPIFAHGEGRGATGCVAVSPPSFMSEDEALVVIKEEFKKHGIELNKEKVVLKDVMIAHGIDEWVAMGATPEGENIEPLEIDLSGSEKDINVEFVSRDDFSKLGGALSASTVQAYDFKQIAIDVRNQLQVDAKNGVYAVFYDPMTSIDYSEISNDESIPTEDRWKVMQQRSLESSKELLRQQVNDFAAWLKEQGQI